MKFEDVLALMPVAESFRVQGNNSEAEALESIINEYYTTKATEEERKQIETPVVQYRIEVRYGAKWVPECPTTLWSYRDGSEQIEKIKQRGYRARLVSVTKGKPK